MTLADTALKQTLRSLLARWDEADRLAREHRAAWDGTDPAEAEAARLRVEGELWALGHDLSDLLLMLLRETLLHDPGTLRGLLMGLLAPDVGALVKTILKERGRR